MKNEIFQQIYGLYEKDLEKLYLEESACLLIFRNLPSDCQQTIIRVINIDEILNLEMQTLVKKINWCDIFDNHTNDIKEAVRMLYSFKILTSRENIILNTHFKQNMLNIFNRGILPKGVVLENKMKSWAFCYEHGINALEKYLVAIHDLDEQEIDVKSENEKIKFLFNSGLIIKDNSINKVKLTQFAINTLLADRQLQIRFLILKYIYTNKTEDNDNNLKFLHFLFSLCTLDIGLVK